MNNPIEPTGIWVAHTQDLQERCHLLVDCRYKNRNISVFIVRFSGQCYGYLNRCVHMPFRLDCEQAAIIDPVTNHIKCSMHGIIYDPFTGASLSPTLCTGEKLTAVNVVEDAQGIWLVDSNLSPLTILQGQ